MVSLGQQKLCGCAYFLFIPNYHTLKNQLRVSFLFLAFLFSISSHGKIVTKSPLTAKGRSVFIATRDSGEYVHLFRALEYWGYWNIVTDTSEADFILRIRSRKGLNYRVYAVLINPENGQEIARTHRVGTFWSFTFNPKKRAMRKLVKKRLRRHYYEVKGNPKPQG